LLAASAVAFTVVKLLGAAYLLYLGATALWHARRGTARNAAPTEVSAVPLERRAAFKQGMWSNLLNPKIALIFVTLLPQFVGDGEPRLTTTAELAVVFIALAVLWWRLFSLLVAALGAYLSKARVRTVFERITGTVLIGLGLRVAFE
jgi:threonine/homoserine/homoserine lactone efflux protein